MKNLIIVFILITTLSTNAQQIKHGTTITVRNADWECGGADPATAEVVLAKGGLAVYFNWDNAEPVACSYKSVSEAFKYWKAEGTWIVGYNLKNAPRRECSIIRTVLGMTKADAADFIWFVMEGERVERLWRTDTSAVIEFVVDDCMDVKGKIEITTKGNLYWYDKDGLFTPEKYQQARAKEWLKTRFKFF